MDIILGSFFSSYFHQEASGLELFIGTCFLTDFPSVHLDVRKCQLYILNLTPQLIFAANLRLLSYHCTSSHPTL